MDFPCYASGIAIANLYLQALTLLISSGTTNIPFAIIFLMMYPFISKVKYEQMGEVFRVLKFYQLPYYQFDNLGPFIMFFCLFSS
jgi:ACR3 family arsenite transporter